MDTVKRNALIVIVAVDNQGVSLCSGVDTDVTE